MNLQQYRFKFLTVSKHLTITVLAIGFVISLYNILDFNKARRIEAMNGPEFRQLIDTYNYQRAPLRSLQAIAKKALNILPQEIEASKQATIKILKMKDDCLDCQNRLVFFDLNKNDKLTEAGIRALHSSYQLSPYGDTELMKWRLEVASNFWTDLDEDLHKSSLTQITALSQFQKGRFWLRAFDTDVKRIKDRIARVANN